MVDDGAVTSDGRHEFIENAGMYFARLGLSRTSGRVLGWLLISPTGAADAPELCAELDVAKSSMSVALRQLDGGGLVERFRPARQRRDHYRLAEDVFERAFRLKMVEFEAFRALMTQGLNVVGDAPEPRARLELMSDMYGFMAREFPKLLRRWDREKQRKAEPRR